MISKFANCKMTVEELDLYMYEHGLSIERYVMAMFKAKGNDVKCQNFYVPVQQTQESEILNSGILEMFKRVLTMKNDEDPSFWILIIDLDVKTITYSFENAKCYLIILEKALQIMSKNYLKKL